MSEGLVLPPVARGSLRPLPERLERLDEAIPQILAAVDGERDPIALQATLAALLWDALPQASWVGFYRRVGATSLAVGPYQGPMGCLRIEFSRGVCGACARTKTSQRVPDVRSFEGHIACDDATLSELVLPVVDGRGAVQAVLDLDSRHLDAFSASEQERLERLVARALGSAVAWDQKWPTAETP
ncbi:MAG TPA: GAF domain-containing protein [Polyangiaceae bacterium]